MSHRLGPGRSVRMLQCLDGYTLQTLAQNVGREQLCRAAWREAFRLQVAAAQEGPSSGVMLAQLVDRMEKNNFPVGQLTQEDLLPLLEAPHREARMKASIMVGQVDRVAGPAREHDSRRAGSAGRT